MEKDPGVQAVVDAVNATKDPQKTFAILCAILKAVKEVGVEFGHSDGGKN